MEDNKEMYPEEEGREGGSREKAKNLERLWIMNGHRDSRELKYVNNVLASAFPLRGIEVNLIFRSHDYKSTVKINYLINGDCIIQRVRMHSYLIYGDYKTLFRVCSQLYVLLCSLCIYL